MQGSGTYYYQIQKEDGTYVYLPATGVCHVTRCKHCTYYEPDFGSEYGYCHYWEHEEGTEPNMVMESDFCSNAEEA